MRVLDKQSGVSLRAPIFIGKINQMSLNLCNLRGNDLNSIHVKRGRNENIYKSGNVIAAFVNLLFSEIFD
jgi:hypothetical protein